MFLIVAISPAWAGTWLDDFENDSLAAWSMVNSNEKEVSWWTDKGVFVAQSEPNQGAPAGWLSGEERWSNYELTCKFRIVEARKRFMTIGVLYHVQWDNRMLYVLEIIPIWNVAVLTKVLPNKSENIGQLNIIPKLGIWDTFTLSSDKEGRIHFRVGLGNNLIVGDPEPITHGKFGVTIRGVKAEFDDIQVVGDSVDDGGPALAIRENPMISTTWGDIKNR